MNDKQIKLVAAEALSTVERWEPAATKAERALFIRGAVWGFRAGEATYRNWKRPDAAPASAPPTSEASETLMHAVATQAAIEHLTDPDTGKRDEQRVFGTAELMDVAMDAIRAWLAVSPIPAPEKEP